MDNSEKQQETAIRPASEPSAARRWFRRVVLAVGCICLVAAFWLRGERLSRLDRAAVTAAMEKWSQQRPHRYELEFELTGRMQASYRMIVDDGQVESAWRDGQPLQRLPRAWTVDGMFDTLLADLDMLERAGRREPGARFLRMLGVLDTLTGIPRRYLRVEMVERGANPESGWNILKLTPLEGS